MEATCSFWFLTHRCFLNEAMNEKVNDTFWFMPSSCEIYQSLLLEILENFGQHNIAIDTHEIMTSFVAYALFIYKRKNSFLSDEICLCITETLVPRVIPLYFWIYAHNENFSNFFFGYIRSFPKTLVEVKFNHFLR